MAATKVKQILATNMHHTIHKRYQHNLNQIKGMLQRNNLTIARADKNKAIVIMNKDSLEQKVEVFIQENHIMHLTKDPTAYFKNKSTRPFKNVAHSLRKADINIY